MKRRALLILLLLVVLVGAGAVICSTANDERFVYRMVDPDKETITFHWKDSKGERYGSLKRLKTELKSQNKELLFAMNGGMYMRDHSPQGLYIQNRSLVTPVDTNSGEGNFYMKPNGIFYINKDGSGAVCRTEEFPGIARYATQSGPMLVIDGEIHPEFKKGSSNLNIRNGVGITEDGKVLLAMSKEEVNFYDFAEFFLKAGCKDALYLDGYVSRTYAPDQNWIQLDGNFGVIIGVTSSKKNN